MGLSMPRPLTGGSAHPAVVTLQSASSLTPVSVYQVLAAAGPAAVGGLPLIGGRPVYLVSLVCRVSIDAISDGSTTTCTLSDHTGWVRAIHTPLAVSATEPVPLPVGDGYFLVVGKPKGATSERHIDIDTMRPITTPDELTAHLLAVLCTHLERSRGPVAPCHEAGDVRTVLEGGHTAAIQQRVLAVCQSAPESGVFTRDIVTALQGHANAEEISAALQWLSNEGLIFTTVSDDQWKAES